MRFGNKWQSCLLVLFILFIAFLPKVSANLEYEKEIKIRKERTVSNISYVDTGALINTEVSFVIVNTGNGKRTFNYSFEAFRRYNKGGGKLTLSPGETAVIRENFSKKILGPTFKTLIDMNLMVDNRYLSQSYERGEYTVNLPDNSTILNFDPKPTRRKDSKYFWVKKDYLPIFEVEIGWIKADVNLKLSKRANKMDIKRGGKVRVTNEILNEGRKDYNLKIRDIYPAAIFNPVNESKFLKMGPTSSWSLFYWIYEDTVHLEKGKGREIEHEFRIKEKLPYDRSFRSQGFVVSIPGLGYSKDSNHVGFNISICNEDGICQSELRENYKTCRVDCPSGGLDNYCDGIDDGKCDPDCDLAYKDPDCQEKYNNYTEGDKGSVYDYLMFAVLILILIFVILFLYRKIR
ncbi:MAG: hypothetical protein ABEK36_04080 [Candidatus Aenigmatarchaeota archaeon]